MISKNRDFVFFFIMIFFAPQNNKSWFSKIILKWFFKIVIFLQPWKFASLRRRGRQPGGAAGRRGRFPPSHEEERLVGGRGEGAETPWAPHFRTFIIFP